MRNVIETVRLLFCQGSSDKEYVASLVEVDGGLKLARQFGESLLCVRHRIDDHGEYRYTTVELLVDKARVQPRSDHVVGVRVEPHEKALQQLVRAAGGSWDYKARVWRLPRRVAGILRLTDRIAEK